MKTLRPLFAAASFCLLASFASAQQFTWEQELTPQQILNEMVASAKYRPKQVVTLEAFEMPLVLDGKPSGSVKVNAGTPLEVVSVKTDGVIIDIHGNETKLPIDKTDLLSRYAARKKEVDQQVEEERLALVEEGQQMYVAPPKPVVVQVPQDTQVVYVDNSQPRININAGDYWPYTNTYYSVPASYVVSPYPNNYYGPNPYYNPYYCHPNGPVNPNYPVQPRPTPMPVGTPVVAKPAYTGNALFYTKPVTPVAHPYAPAR